MRTSERTIRLLVAAFLTFGVFYYGWHVLWTVSIYDVVRWTVVFTATVGLGVLVWHVTAPPAD